MVWCSPHRSGVSDRGIALSVLKLHQVIETFTSHTQHPSGSIHDLRDATETSAYDTLQCCLPCYHSWSHIFQPVALDHWQLCRDPHPVVSSLFWWYYIWQVPCRWRWHPHHHRWKLPSLPLPLLQWLPPFLWSGLFPSQEWSWCHGCEYYAATEEDPKALMCDHCSWWSHRLLWGILWSCWWKEAEDIDGKLWWHRAHDTDLSPWHSTILHQYWHSWWTIEVCSHSYCTSLLSAAAQCHCSSSIRCGLHVEQDTLFGECLPISSPTLSNMFQPVWYSTRGCCWSPLLCHHSHACLWSWVGMPTCLHPLSICQTQPDWWRRYWVAVVMHDQAHQNWALVLGKAFINFDCS